MKVFSFCLCWLDSFQREVDSFFTIFYSFIAIIAWFMFNCSWNIIENYLSSIAVGQAISLIYIYMWYINIICITCQNSFHAHLLKFVCVNSIKNVIFRFVKNESVRWIHLFIEIIHSYQSVNSCDVEIPKIVGILNYKSLANCCRNAVLCWIAKKCRQNAHFSISVKRLEWKELKREKRTNKQLAYAKYREKALFADPISFLLLLCTKSTKVIMQIFHLTKHESRGPSLCCN